MKKRSEKSMNPCQLKIDDATHLVFVFFEIFSHCHLQESLFGKKYHLYHDFVFLRSLHIF